VQLHQVPLLNCDHECFLLVAAPESLSSRERTGTNLGDQLPERARPVVHVVTQARLDLAVAQRILAAALGTLEQARNLGEEARRIWEGAPPAGPEQGVFPGLQSVMAVGGKIADRVTNRSGLPHASRGRPIYPALPD